MLRRGLQEDPISGPGGVARRAPLEGRASSGRAFDAVADGVGLGLDLMAIAWPGSRFRASSPASKRPRSRRPRGDLRAASAFLRAMSLKSWSFLEPASEVAAATDSQQHVPAQPEQDETPPPRRCTETERAGGSAAASAGASRCASVRRGGVEID